MNSFIRKGSEGRASRVHGSRTDRVCANPELARVDETPREGTRLELTLIPASMIIGNGTKPYITILPFGWQNILRMC